MGVKAECFVCMMRLNRRLPILDLSGPFYVAHLQEFLLDEIEEHEDKK